MEERNNVKSANDVDFVGILPDVGISGVNLNYYYTVFTQAVLKCTLIVNTDRLFYIK